MISQQHISSITHYVPKEHIYNAINRFASTLSQNSSLILITNLSKSYLIKKKFFCLVITSKKVIFTKKVRNKKITFVYLTQQHSITVNKKPGNYKHLLTFMKCLEMTLSKIISKDVTIYNKG